MDKQRKLRFTDYLAYAGVALFVVFAIFVGPHMQQPASLRAEDCVPAEVATTKEETRIPRERNP